MEKKYWKSIEEKNNLPIENPGAADQDASKSLLDLINEEVSQKPSSRRNFLKFCGFSFATAAIATSCKNPVNKAVPYLIQPEEVMPGMASHYATTFFDGTDYSSLVVKVRDGRPIKIEGNDLSAVNKGGTTARVQASVLSLYDDGARFKTPLIEGKEATWETIDAEINKKLTDVQASGKKIALVTPTVISPSTIAVINVFKAKYSAVQHIMYDAVSYSAMLEANAELFGKQVLPDLNLDKADVIVSFAADFLGSWYSPVDFNRKFADSRRLSDEKKTMSQLHVFESGMSLTGANADYRYPVRYSEIPSLIAGLYNKLSGGTSTSKDIDAVAARLLASKGKAVVVCGINDKPAQILVNAINFLIGAYDGIIDLSSAYHTRQGKDQEMALLVAEMNAGNIGAVLFNQVNPVYDLPMQKELIAGLQKVALKIGISTATDETMAVCNYICPDHHYLESWGDAEPKTGILSLQQPLIRNIYDTRQLQDTLLKWSGDSNDYHGFLKNFWISNYAGKQSKYLSSSDFWNHALQDGVLEVTTPVVAVAQPAADLVAKALEACKTAKSSGTDLVFYESVALGTGKQSNNPWLMEMPDPVSKVCWDNFASVSPAYAAANKINNGDLLKLAENLVLPAFVQPGQAENTISIALGYGRKNTGKVADEIGANVYPFFTVKDGNRQAFLTGATITVTGDTYPLSTTQMHHSMEGREIVRDTTFAEWQKNPVSGNEMHEEVEKHKVAIYKEYKFEGHHWAMAIDLNACTGCSSCVIGCQAENNVPVIGKEEVGKTRIMHWIRIDRYYSDNEGNPGVYFQPVMCQHCDNAPCENVCPVSATNHSSEGLNQMAYNRCIGTKYCINNCPYKVRRFNWYRYVTNDAFDYNMNSDLGRMVLNPDVTVRERGVVEKCSFCVQRIQEKKLLAKNEGRELKDGEIIPACGQACPSGAIIFGDLNDPNSRIAKMFADKRNYHLIEEINTLPSVGYLTKVRNNEGNKC